MSAVVAEHTIAEVMAWASKRWYRYGWSSPGVLYGRLRSAHPWRFRFRMARQRAFRGYSDEQCWNLSHALATLTVTGVQRMREWKHGYPGEFSDEYGDGGGWNKWDGILKRIEEGFQAYLDEDGWFHDKPEAEAKFKDGMALYAEWFGALWD